MKTILLLIGIGENLYKIYRYSNDLNDTLRKKIQEISVNHIRKILGGKIGLVFYDVTTLYFETENADELRKAGFSKDGKHANCFGLIAK